MIKSILLGALATLGACVLFESGGSGGSGVSGGKRLVDLTPAEVSQICEHEVATAPPQRTINCPEGTITISPGDVADCIDGFTSSAAAAPNCPATVSQYEACSAAIQSRTDAQICANDFPQQCSVFLSPACVGDDAPPPPPQP